MKRLLLVIVVLSSIVAKAQDANALAQKVKAKLAKVKDYEAKANMVTEVSFMKVPPSDILVYYKNPDKFKIKKQDGIAVTPKGGMSVNLSGLFAGDRFAAVAAGTTNFNGTTVTILKLIPLDEKTDVVASTLYINEKELLIVKAITTTKDNGSYEMEFSYGKYSDWGLPDKVVFIFDTKDYKLPKGIAFDYDPGIKKTKPAPSENTKGRVTITYTTYSINKGIKDAVFN
ncbi:MAG: hypothetical protein K2P88_17800 [Chitinophagaceae bacterium]|nr:hypothetical protein [Chitinophagaceae bacterium]